MRLSHFAQYTILALAFSVIFPDVVTAQQSADQLLKQYRPVQQDVEYDIPEAADLAKCRVDVERGNGVQGYVIYGPAGQVLRRFTDTDGDGNVDLYRYYRMGLEVYRDVDSNKNKKVDQHRWMNWGGTRWGLDPNEDGKIDSWKILSAQEAARIAVEAMIRGDIQALSTVMINAEDILSGDDAHNKASAAGVRKHDTS